MTTKKQNSKVKFGVIGLSRIALKRMLSAIGSSEYSELSMVGSRNSEKAKEVAAQFGADKWGTYEEVLENKDIQAVYISLPNSLHEEWTVKALEAGKHVICEKPAAISYAAAKRMVGAAKKNKVRLLEGLMFRYHPQQIKVKELIEQGTLGRLTKFDGCLGFTMPEETDIAMKKDLEGGSLNSCAVYPVSASRMVFGEEPVSVFCRLEIDPKSGVDIGATVLLEYSEGRTASTTSFFGSYFQSTYSVLGTKAHIRMGRAYAVPSDMGTKIFLDSNDRVEEIGFPPIDHFKLMVDDFCKEIFVGQASTKDYEDDLLAQARILEAARISNAEKRVVNISEIH
ncbi:MAG: Gfo/Idh/MocA family oxidoreductase [Patescibacteria group bacterium]